MKQLNEEKGFFVWLSEMFSTHPPLPKRIDEISNFFGKNGQRLIEPNKLKVLWFFVSVTIVCCGIGLLMGSYYMINKFIEYAPMDYGYEEDEAYYEENIEISPFIKAVVNRELDQVSMMIENGEDVYQEDYYGNTALEWAVRSGNPDMVKFLLESGADANYESSYGTTALMTAAEIGDPALVKLLIEAGGDPNYQEYSGSTALTYAIYSSDIETVQTLLEAGADPSLTDSEDMDAYMVAIQSGEREIAQLLKNY